MSNKYRTHNCNELRKKHVDNRGKFVRYFSKDLFKKINFNNVQSNLSYRHSPEIINLIELLTNENMGEYLDKARKTVSKNLAANPLHYVENAAFGQEGIGYTKDAVSLKPTEIKGKYVESGYGDATKKEANDKFVEVKESKVSFNDLLND